MSQLVSFHICIKTLFAKTVKVYIYVIRILITGVMITGWQVGGVCLYSANCMSPNQYDPSSDTAYSKVICNEWHSCSSQQLPNKMIFCLSSLYWDLCIEHPGNKEIYSAVMYYSCLLVSLLREYFRFLSSDIRHGQNC